MRTKVKHPATREAASATPKFIIRSKIRGNMSFATFISIKKVYTIYMHWYNRFHLSKNAIRVGFWGLTHFVLLIILSYNIVLSQTVSSLYGKFVQDEKNSIGQVLNSIQPLPEFNKLYLIYKNKYGAKVENEVFAEEKKDRLFLSNLEKILEQNPQSRDINYNLSQILKKEGGGGAAYLIRAREIDPEIN